MRDRDLVRLHWPRELRPAFDALFAIDDAMADVVASATQPALGAIKLAWWRENLEKLDREPPPAEPRLRAAAQELLPRGVAGHELAGLEAGWATLLAQTPEVGQVAQRGARLFTLAARLLGADSPRIEEAGALFAQMDAIRRHLWAMDRVGATKLPRFPSGLRPLTGLAALAARDALRGTDEPEATPGRSWTLLRHRITGRI